MIRLDREALHVEDIVIVDRHEQLDPVLGSVGVLAYCISVAAFFDFALFCLCAIYAYVAG